ncbi:MAG: ribonuclease domain-containing protein [Minisyncoccia bacterium]
MKLGLRIFATVLLLLLTVIFVPPHTQSAPQTRAPSAPSRENIRKPQTELHATEKTIAYLREHGSLPDYYLTKREASKLGWVPSRGNLCEVAPGMYIGGDIFTNAQKLLPTAKNRKWYEADFDYACGNRNARRILFSNDGLIYITYDHYKTVTPAP